jgi:hypothetical protein
MLMKSLVMELLTLVTLRNTWEDLCVKDLPGTHQGKESVCVCVCVCVCEKERVMLLQIGS